MEKLIPIIFALIWLGFKLYQKSAKESPKAESENTNSQATLDEILKSLYSEPKVAVEQVEIQREYKSVKTLQNDKKKEKSDNLESIEYSDLKVSKPNKTEAIQEKVQSKKTENTDYEFSLRQAIIYQTILERPYKY